MADPSLPWSPATSREWPEQFKPIPDNAHKDYRDILEKHDALVAAFLQHPSLPASHPLGQPLPGSKIFYMFDFVCRTRIMGQELNPQRPNSNREKYMDVLGRQMFTNMLINDTSGKLSMMTGEKPGEEVDFGDDIKEKARELAGNSA